MCKITPIGVRLNLKNFILISCAVLELLRKVPRGGGRNPPPTGEIGLRIEHLCNIIPKAQSWLVLNLPVFCLFT